MLDSKTGNFQPTPTPGQTVHLGRKRIRSTAIVCTVSARYSVRKCAKTRKVCDPCNSIICFNHRVSVKSPCYAMFILERANHPKGWDAKLQALDENTCRGRAAEGTD